MEHSKCSNTVYFSVSSFPEISDFKFQA